MFYGLNQMVDRQKIKEFKTKESDKRERIKL